MNKKVGIGLIGSQFISTIHAESIKLVSDAELLAVMSPTEGHAKAFAEKFNIPAHFTDLDQMLHMDDIELVVIGAPNYLHCEMTLKAAASGKHIVVEKPLCMNLAEADRMIEACKKSRCQTNVRRGALFHPKICEA